ncbi:MAG: alkaline phosphatase D family protein [Ignavibacteriaceae bacterium]
MKLYYKLNLFYILILLTSTAYTQHELLQSGPMAGYSEMREAALWVQTKESAAVKIVYWDKETPDKHFETDEVTTIKETAFTAKLYADNVEPGRQYEYKLLLNNSEAALPYPLEFQTLKLWQWREDAPDFTFVIGSCAYVNEPVYDRPGNPYGGNYEIFTSIKDKDPDFMIWMGDNTYLREVDWNSRTGILKRYTHTRSLPEMQPLLGSTHNYAVWDDHDFGPNDSDRGSVHKNTALDAFKLFWANPSYGVNDKPGVTTRFEWSDVEFFLLDNRYYRAPNNRKTGDRVMFGDEQIQWLADALVSSKAVFKIIVTGGQVLNPNPAGERFSIYTEEREKLLELIMQEGITGVIFFTGDIHSSQITRLERKETYPLYEFTISPLTAGVYTPDKELNPLSIPEYKTFERNFGYFSVTGPKNNRVITCINYNYAGKEMWKFSLKESELK